MKGSCTKILWISLILVALLSGCTPWIVPSRASNSQWEILNSNNSIGQTLIATYDGLEEVQFLIAPQNESIGTLTFHLRTDPNSTVDIATAQLNIQEITQQKYVRFDFPGLEKSNNQYYYAFIELTGEGSLDIGSTMVEAYQNGSAYQNHEPIERQLTFSLGYDQGMMIRGLVIELFKWIGYLLVGIVLFTVPGWALLRFLWQGWNNLFFWEKVPLSIGTSLALYSLLVLCTYLLHLQFGLWYAWIPVISGFLFLIYKNYRNLIKAAPAFQSSIKMQTKKISSIIPNLLLLIILLMIFFTRFWALRGINIPMWNDSFHHTEITQLLLDNKGLFSSWLPYAQYKTFSMHFGFPLASALFSWITKVNSQLSVLYIGQILSIFAALSLFPITVRFSKGNRLGGVVAVLAAGLLSPMPAYYLNWGRYAQLAGQVILPVCMWMLWDVLEHNRKLGNVRKIKQLPWIKIFITAGTITGMILAEYRMIFIIATFFVAWMLGWGFSTWKKDKTAWSIGLLTLFLIGIISIILFLPWGLRIQNSQLINYSTFQQETNDLINLVSQDYKAWQSVFYYVPMSLVFIAILGWIWSIIQRDWKTFSIGIWVALMSILYSLILFKFPWVHYVQSFAVIISLYIPVAVLCGYLSATLSVGTHRWRFIWIPISLLIICLGVYGVWRQKEMAKPDTYALVTHPDELAMDWISNNTPEDSLFLVEGTHINWVTNIVGTDGGWWIPLLAGRENTMPPQYAISNEIPIEPGYSLSLIDLVSNLETTSLESQAGTRLLCDYGITHVYIGQKQGMVGNTGSPLFTPVELAASPVLRQIYHQDRVYIYAVEGACDQ